MKSFKRIICFLVVCMMLVSALSSCTTRLKIKNGKMTDTRNDIVYSYVYTTVYEPKSIATESYAKWKYNGVTINYYQIEGLEPTEWLVSEVGEILCATGEIMPDLDGFEPKSALICYNSSVVMSLYAITDTARIDEIVERYMEGESEVFPADPNASYYSLKFESDKYPGFYYSLSLVVYEDSTYLYDKYAGKYVEMGRLFDEYGLYDGEISD